MRVVVTGPGVAGATAALALARQGHRVQVLHRDDGLRPVAVADAAAWERRGIAHFGQPHALLARLHA
ncbi:MAG TPA: NAD-binding protein, partial [Geodermatophilus sp.]|nr:NAD-binding protein [Geodermatophilus sp.]